MYKIDVPFLASLGVSGSIASSVIRLFGNGGAMLPEANSASRIDDLQENAIMVMDGGDGVLNGSDYILFYASGPNHWYNDSVNHRFSHKKNLYSDKAYYYLSLGGVGKRISNQTATYSPDVTVTSFDERIYHELDSINFLSSGKEWYGEEFSDAPGHNLSTTFTVPVTDALVGQPATIMSSVVARSVNAASRFDVAINGSTVQQVSVPAVTAVYLDAFAQQAQQASTFSLGQNNAAVTYTFSPGSFNVQGWLNWFELFYRRHLSYNNQTLFFRDWTSTGRDAATFIIDNATTSLQVWDITDPLQPVKMNTAINGNRLTFNNDAKTLHEYVCFANNFLVPQAVGAVPNQDLHNTTAASYLIITYPLFLAQAQRLAVFHQQKDKLQPVVVTTSQVFNEFSGGIPDPAALRDFVKMYYDTYRSAWNKSEKYLLLFGAASFDYKDRVANNTNYVPCYENPIATDPLATYTTDDFFGFLDDKEDINSGLLINRLDIGIGRTPCKNEEEAKNFVDKVEAYRTAFGPWRNNLDFVADDGDYNLHLQDAESITSNAATIAPVFNQQKIYLDAFKKEGGSAGGQYPQVKELINNTINNGTLLLNYNGHGSPDRLAEEAVIDQPMVNSWNNADKLPLFITASCDFAPYDIPSSTALGINLLVRPKTGAIALMTTTRVVFAYSNRIMNDNYLQVALKKDSSGHYKTLGTAVKEAKNYTYQTSSDLINNRKFTLLGDPAMTLGFPQLTVQATAVNSKDITSSADTVSATQLVTIQGRVVNDTGTIVSSFNGTAYATLFDKPQTITTLGNDATSQPVPFQLQTNALFKGKVTVTGGNFVFTFRMPKDINYQYGKGKLSLYAQNGAIDGNGFSTNIIIGGVDTAAVADKEGPVINAYLNDEKFVNGSITNPSPVLIVKLADSSGINTAGTGIGHDLIATLDNDNKTFYTLNNFFESDLNSYQKGSLRFQLPQLTPGHHTLTIKAWDVLNNSSEYNLEFTVINSDQLEINHVLNYPNPFTNHTTFWFEHNQPLTDLKVKVEIFTVSGKLIKTIQQTINDEGNRSSEVQWNGKDEFGSKVGRGVYIYRLTVRSANGKQVNKLEKLVIL